MKTWVPPETARYIGAGLQLAFNVLLGVGLGLFADKKLGTLPLGMLLGGLFGFMIGLYIFLRGFNASDGDH